MTRSDDVLPRSGLYEDKMKAAPSARQRVDEAASTLLALVPSLPEHGKEDESPEQEATTRRLGRVLALLEEHLTSE